MHANQPAASYAAMPSSSRVTVGRYAAWMKLYMLWASIGKTGGHNVRYTDTTLFPLLTTHTRREANSHKPLALKFKKKSRNFKINISKFIHAHTHCHKYTTHHTTTTRTHVSCTLGLALKPASALTCYNKM